MKFRNGFVSNSSGSSFIIGIAAISDREKFDAWIKRSGIPIDKYDVSVADFDELIERGGYDDYVKNKDGGFSVFSFDDVTHVDLSYDAVFNASKSRSPDKEAKRLLTGHEGEVFVVRIFNDEGDDRFWNGYEYDYGRVTASYFTGWQGKLLNEMTEENGLSAAQVAFGAGRNG